MVNDPIIDEVRRYRRKRAAKFHFDIDAIAEDARRRERACGHKVVRAPKRKAREKAQ
jgi:hypothetical protein